VTDQSVRTVFFLSDFGTQDEFAGVVRAVIAARAPDATVIDLTHEIPPFDVRAGSHTLVRAVPHLGAGVVLAVVDPGVGTTRRAVALEVERRGGPLYFVGPDNGLLVAAAEKAAQAAAEAEAAGAPGGTVAVARAVELRAPPSAAGSEPAARGRTFDGRDVFGPAAADLCAGVALEHLGEAIDPASLVRLINGVVDIGRLDDGRPCMRAEVTWVDRYGNLQLAATETDAGVAGLPSVGRIELVSLTPGGGHGDPDVLPSALVPEGTRLCRVDAFSDLPHGELGLLVDANGHLAVVAREASAAMWLNVTAGELVVLAW
jgi:S-adenosyl-L-methionine hydrolase (adenosine-forming)